MVNALWITLIGMGLVFLAILLLWGLLALLVRITAEPRAAVKTVEPPPGGPLAAEAQQLADSDSLRLIDRKRQAAAAAVAAALSLQKQPPEVFAPLPRSSEPAGLVSPWQAVQRAGQLSRRFNPKRR